MFQNDHNIVESSEPRRPFRLTLRQLMKLVALVCFFLSATCWAFRQGVAEGVVVLVCLFSLALLVLGARTYNKGLSVLGSVGLAVSLLFTLCGVLVVGVGDGWPRLPCEIAVLDGDTLEPVVGAVVEIRKIDPETLDRSVKPPRATGVTDTVGHVILRVELPVSSRDGLFAHSTRVYIGPDLWLHISSPGYSQELVSLDTFTGTACDYHRLPFDTMVVHLTKETSNGK